MVAFPMMIGPQKLQSGAAALASGQVREAASQPATTTDACAAATSASQCLGLSGTCVWCCGDIDSNSVTEAANGICVPAAAGNSTFHCPRTLLSGSYPQAPTWPTPVVAVASIVIALYALALILRCIRLWKHESRNIHAVEATEALSKKVMMEEEKYMPHTVEPISAAELTDKVRGIRPMSFFGHLLAVAAAATLVAGLRTTYSAPAHILQCQAMPLAVPTPHFSAAIAFLVFHYLLSTLSAIMCNRRTTAILARVHHQETPNLELRLAQVGGAKATVTFSVTAHHDESRTFASEMTGESERHLVDVCTFEGQREFHCSVVEDVSKAPNLNGMAVVDAAFKTTYQFADLETQRRYIEEWEAFRSEYADKDIKVDFEARLTVDEVNEGEVAPFRIGRNVRWYMSNWVVMLSHLVGCGYFVVSAIELTCGKMLIGVVKRFKAADGLDAFSSVEASLQALQSMHGGGEGASSGEVMRMNSTRNHESSGEMTSLGIFRSRGGDNYAAQAMPRPVPPAVRTDIIAPVVPFLRNNTLAVRTETSYTFESYQSDGEYVDQTIYENEDADSDRLYLNRPGIAGPSAMRQFQPTPPLARESTQYSDESQPPPLHPNDPVTLRIQAAGLNEKAALAAISKSSGLEVNTYLTRQGQKQKYLIKNPPNTAPTLRSAPNSHSASAGNNQLPHLSLYPPTPSEQDRGYAPLELAAVDDSQFVDPATPHRLLTTNSVKTVDELPSYRQLSVRRTSTNRGNWNDKKREKKKMIKGSDVERQRTLAMDEKVMYVFAQDAGVTEGDLRRNEKRRESESSKNSKGTDPRSDSDRSGTDGRWDGGNKR